MGPPSVGRAGADAGARAASRGHGDRELGGPSRVLRRPADRKVTNLPSPNGRTARIANSFGLPAGRAHSCPGATTTCERVCYAGKLEKLYKGVLEVLTGSMRALLGLDRAGMAQLLADMIAGFRIDCDR